MPTIQRRRDCTWLMTALFVVIILSPIFQLQGVPGRVLMSVVMTLVLVGGIRAVSDSKQDLIRAGLLTVPPLLVLWLTHALQLDRHQLWLDASFYSIPVYLYLGYLVFLYIFEQGKVTTDHLHGAISLYLLIGLTWTYVYVILERLAPGSFRFPEGSVVEYGDLVAEFIYYSYVTLTTLGYGDIQPVSSWARTLSLLEAITGVLFMGALVARIAGALGPIGQNAGAADD